jgi:hypothetical protein
MGHLPSCDLDREFQRIHLCMTWRYDRWLFSCSFKVGNFLAAFATSALLCCCNAGRKTPKQQPIKNQQSATPKKMANSLLLMVARASVVPCFAYQFKRSQCDFDVSSVVGKVAVVSAVAVGGAYVGLKYGYFENKHAPPNIPQTTANGVLLFSHSNNNSQSIKVTNEASTCVVKCDVHEGIELLTRKGPEVGSHLFNLKCRTIIANATRSERELGFEGSYTLDGDARIFFVSGGAAVLSRQSAVQRLEGECAVLKQWLKLKHLGHGEDCKELSESKVAEKRKLLAAGIALIALLEISFEESATFIV